MDLRVSLLICKTLYPVIKFESEARLRSLWIDFYVPRPSRLNVGSHQTYKFKLN